MTSARLSRFLGTAFRDTSIARVTIPSGGEVALCAILENQRMKKRRPRLQANRIGLVMGITFGLTVPVWAQPAQVDTPLVWQEAIASSSQVMSPVPEPGAAPEPAVPSLHNPAAVNRSPVEWWQPWATSSMRTDVAVLPVNIESLIYDALAHSPRIQAIHENVAIAETGIASAVAGFDPRVFMESKFNRLNIPTGSALDAGFNVDRLIEKNWYYSGGLRRKNIVGGNWELSQRLGTRDSNSQFFFPANQGNSRLTLNYTQPLLNGAGKPYNRSLIVLANLSTKIAKDRTLTEIQDQLLTIYESHWELYRNRTYLLQKRRNYERALHVLNYLQQRRTIDAFESQIAQVQSAVTTRTAELAQCETAIRNAESKLRALVNSPTILSDRNAELLPVESPNPMVFSVPAPDALVTAMENRPDVDQVLQEIESSRVRLNIARKELLPVLDVVLESYISGLRGGYDVGQSWVDQFAIGGPSYTAGLVFEVPLGRRAAKAQETRREAELRQLTNQFRALTEDVYSDVDIAIRDIETSLRLLQAKEQAIFAADMNVQFFQRRWEVLPGDDRSATFHLQDLLEAQDRLLTQEDSFVQSQIDYVMSIARFKRATGQLLQCRQ
jgi:outer membrane protein TolC